MTYGWAILVVLAAIGALAYFGILNPQRFLPDSCSISGGISCVEFQAIQNDVTGFGLLKIGLINNVGSDFSMFELDVQSADCANPLTWQGLNVPAAEQHTQVAGVCAELVGAAFPSATTCFHADTTAGANVPRNGRYFSVDAAGAPAVMTTECPGGWLGSKVQADVTVAFRKSSEVLVQRATGQIKVKTVSV